MMILEQGYKKQRNSHGDTAEVTGKVVIFKNVFPCVVQLVNDGTPLQGELLALLLR